MMRDAVDSREVTENTAILPFEALFMLKDR